MPKDNPPRWITVRKAPFDYRFPDRSAILAFSEPGEFMVKGEVADYAVANGYATEGKVDGSEARSRKGKRAPRAKAKATKPAKSAKPAANAATITGSNDSLGDGDLAAHDSASAGQPLADSAE